jgi:hypothetical protein
MQTMAYGILARSRAPAPARPGREGLICESWLVSICRISSNVEDLSGQLTAEWLIGFAFHIPRRHLRAGYAEEQVKNCKSLGRGGAGVDIL